MTSPSCRALEHAEDEPCDERGDEAAAAERDGDSIRQSGTRERDHLHPVVGDQVPPTGNAEDHTRCNTGDDAAHEPPTDLVEHHVDSRAHRDRIVLGLRDREHDEEQRHADPVVEAALDVQALPDAYGQAAVRHHLLPERRVRRREDDRKHERLGPGQLRQQPDRDRHAGDDRQRQPEPEQPRGQPELTAQRTDVDPRCIREEHQRQRRLGQHAHRAAPEVKVEPAQAVAADQEARTDEQDRAGQDGSFEAPRAACIDEDQRSDNGEVPVLHRHDSLPRGLRRKGRRSPLSDDPRDRATTRRGRAARRGRTRRPRARRQQRRRRSGCRSRRS